MQTEYVTIKIDKVTAELIEKEHGDLQEYVRQMLLKQIRHDLMQEEGHYI